MKKDERGQSIVEMALILPVLLLLIVGIIDFGRILYSYGHLHMAAQETVRLGGIGKGDLEMREFAKQYIHLKDPSNLQIVISPEELTRDHGDYVTVQLQYPMEMFTPLISSFFPNPMFIKTDSTIRVE